MKTMELIEVYKRLCYYDKRNPNNIIDTDEPQEPRDNCYCDNCFYGRDRLALEIIELRELLKQI
jgi:hypothetical protein